MADRPAGPYRDGLAALLGATLAAACLIGTIDVLVALSRAPDAHGASTGHLVLIAAGLYAWPAVVLGLIAGVWAGSLTAAFGPGALARSWRRLRGDPRLDQQVTAGLLAAAVVAVVLAGVVAMLSITLVADVQRKETGALLLGVLTVASLPLMCLLALPVYRGTRHLARLVPRPGSLPAALIVVVSSAVLLLTCVAYWVFTRLDWRALDMALFALIAGFVVAVVGWLFLWYGPLARVRASVPHRGYVATGSLVLALLIGGLGLSQSPSGETVGLLGDRSAGGGALLRMYRSLSDGDGDGYSALLSGPDCDDADPNVHPGAREVPGNGIDDNCIGGDRAVVAAVEKPPTAAVWKTRSLFKGNLLVIMIDTVRADRLGVAGYRRAGESMTPNIDALAARSSYFSRAYSQAPGTARSAPSLFASRFPSQIRWDPSVDNFSISLADNGSVFATLADAGVHTSAFTSHSFFAKNTGLRVGVKEWNDIGVKENREIERWDVSAPRIVPKAIEKLAQLSADKRRFSMFVHLYEPHSAYTIHKQFDYREKGYAAFRERYDYEIKFADAWVGRLLAGLEKNGLAENTAIVLFSDHGEGFGEHWVGGRRVFFHGRQIYEEMIRVPIIIHVPGNPASRVDSPVMLVDVAPTILDFMGLQPDSRHMGRSLFDAVLGKPLTPKPAFAELVAAKFWKHTHKAMITADGKHKLLYRISDRRFELYDLARDPTEKRNLYQKSGSLSRKLTAQMIDWIEGPLQAP